MKSIQLTKLGLGGLAGLAWALTGTVTIAAGDTTATINVANIVNDDIVEANETVIVTITNVGGDDQTTQAGDAAATVTITDNDVATVSIAANDSTASEAGNNTGQFTLTQTNESSVDTITVSYTHLTLPTILLV